MSHGKATCDLHTRGLRLRNQIRPRGSGSCDEPRTAKLREMAFSPQNAEASAGEHCQPHPGWRNFLSSQCLRLSGRAAEGWASPSFRGSSRGWRRKQAVRKKYLPCNFSGSLFSRPAEVFFRGQMTAPATPAREPRRAMQRRPRFAPGRLPLVGPHPLRYARHKNEALNRRDCNSQPRRKCARVARVHSWALSQEGLLHVPKCSFASVWATN